MLGIQILTVFTMKWQLEWAGWGAFSVILCPAIGFVMITLKARHEELLVWRINEYYSALTSKVSLD